MMYSLMVFFFIMFYSFCLFYLLIINDDTNFFYLIVGVKTSALVEINQVSTVLGVK